MDINRLAINSIESKTVRDYLIKIDHKFSLIEQITLIYNSKLKLKEKLKAFNCIINDSKIDDKIGNQLRKIVSSINIDLLEMDNKNYIYMIYDEDGIPICVKNLEIARNYNKETKLNIDLFNIDVIDLMETDIVNNVKYRMCLDEELDIVGYVKCNTVNADEDFSITEAYVSIPNEFNVGDIVKIDKSNDKYVVIATSEIPEHLIKECDFTDSCITVVPKYVLNDKTKGYKEQIEEIFKNRIKHVKQNEQCIDKLSTEHIHVNICDVEKA